MDGKQFERYARELLSLHYGSGNYTPVPDGHGGDAGIEGYSLSGHAYQCYATEKTSVADQYEAQRDKMSTDLRKFVRNRQKLSALLGDVMVSSWRLMVPKSNSAQLVAHARKKEQEIRNAGLPYVSDDFRVQVVTPEDFPEAKRRLAGVGSGFKIRAPEPEEHEREDWADENQGFIENLVKKLRTVTNTDKRLAVLRRSFLSFHLQSENYLAELKTSLPDDHQELLARHRARERSLEVESLIRVDEPKELLTRLINEYQEELTNRFNWLEQDDARLLVMGAIGEWLGRCPLELRP